MSNTTSTREGSLEAPTRHALDWQSDSFLDEQSLYAELERVFDICHGCRRCVSLCQAFPSLFDLVDESETMEVDGVAKSDYKQVVDHCYLCDMCYLSKCPYVPPHEWNVDFPHLMLRAKAYFYKQQGAPLSHRILSNTDQVGSLAGIPIINQVTNSLNKNGLFRGVLEKAMGVDPKAVVPNYSAKTFRREFDSNQNQTLKPIASDKTTGKVALFTTCYANYNQPEIGRDLAAVFKHNNIELQLLDNERCCGMPKLELGDLDAVAKAKDINIPSLAKMVDQGYDLIALVPSCTLMFKQELPLMFPDDPLVKKVQQAFFDPFEYLALRHKAKLLNTEFKSSLGKISYQVACHLRVQRIGMKTKDILELVPDTEISVIERCSGHDGTYGVRSKTYEFAVKIARPVAKKITQDSPDYVSSDCPMAASHISHLAECPDKSKHPISLLRIAYGI